MGRADGDVSDDKEDEAYLAALALVAWFTCLALAIPLRALVLAQAWTWFVVPLGFPVLGTSHAFGVAIVASLLTHQSHVPPPVEKDQAKARTLLWKSCGTLIGGPLSMLAIAWCAHWCMVNG